MLTDPREIEIISKARQPNVADPRRSRVPFEAIFADFLATVPLEGSLVLDLGPGQFDLHEILSPRGARTAAIDNDPAVIELGLHKGVAAREGNLRELRAADLGGPYDGVFCKFSINAFWLGDDPAAHRAYVAEIDRLLTETGWSWIAPWNGVPKDHADDADYIRRVLDAQESAFREHGFAAYELTDAQTKTYGVHGRVANHPVFTRGLPAWSAEPTTTTHGAPASTARGTASQGSAAPVAFFPFEYFRGFLEFLAAHDDKIEPITYADLDWRKDYRAGRSYPREHRRFKEQSERLLEEGKAQVLIQHDVDAYPDRTHAAVRAELELGIPASIMIFRRRIDRKRLQDTGKVAFTDYDLDDDLLRRAEATGSVIGYHFNTMEQAKWNQRKAQRVFVKDLKRLRKRFDVRFVSAHGGVRGPDGLINRDMVLDDPQSLGVRWVHNGASPKFKAGFSDGAPNSTSLDPTKRDLRDFVRAMRPGGRYRILLHPQYYHSPAGRSVGLSRAPWYTDLLDAHEAGHVDDGWSNVELSW